MNDPRVKNLAKILVRYSLPVKRGDTVTVSGESPAEPLIVAAYEELLKAGAFPVVRMSPAGIDEVFFRHARPHHLTTLTPYSRAVARNTDASIMIYAQSNTRSLTAVPPKKYTALARTARPLAEMRRKRPWVLTLFPTQAYAQDAEMSLAEFEDFVYGATFADRRDPVAAWKALSRRQAKLVSRLRNADEIRIVGPGTDLKLSVNGRRFINSDGSSHNMPSGEIFTAPVEGSAEGCIEYDLPACYRGREVSGVRLVFRKGVVVEVTAEKNQRFLRAMVDADRGARRLGELGIGTNARIDRFTKNILFDEKIGGTVHLALGSAPLDTGGKNRSAIHWDMIKDLRKGGAIYVDGKLFQRDGKFR